jgi:hypothetical protein
MTTNELIEQVNNSVGSIFTKEDVIALLNQVTAEKTSNLLLNDLSAKSIAEDIAMRASNRFDEYNIVNSDDIELSIGYNNKIEIDCANIDEDALAELILDAAEAIIEDVLENLKANQIVLS